VERYLKKIITVLGPTASGKTDIVYYLCNHIKNRLEKEPVIISADSRQVYKDISISTSHPPLEYQKKYKHYLVNELRLEIDYNAGEFGKYGRHLIEEILKEKKLPIICGGSGLYLKSLIYGLFELDFKNEDENVIKVKLSEIRKELINKNEKYGPGYLLKELEKVDPVTAEKLSDANQRRIIRALEVYYLTGIPISKLHLNKPQSKYKFIQYGLNWNRQALYERINLRVDKMIEMGLENEIRNLKQKGYNYKEFNSLNTVGVKEVFDYFDKKLSYQQMVDLIKQNTRRFAKRQMTWFRKDENIQWINITEEKELKKVSEIIYNNNFQQ
jgi:tRNA dimethylallyltransferase